MQRANNENDRFRCVWLAHARTAFFHKTRNVSGASQSESFLCIPNANRSVFIGRKISSINLNVKCCRLCARLQQLIRWLRCFVFSVSYKQNSIICPAESGNNDLLLYIFLLLLLLDGYYPDMVIQRINNRTNVYYNEIKTRAECAQTRVINNNSFREGRRVSSAWCQEVFDASTDCMPFRSFFLYVHSGRRFFFLSPFYASLLTPSIGTVYLRSHF